MSFRGQEGFTASVRPQVRAIAFGCSLLSISLAGCSCDEELTIIFGDLEVVPERLDFGKVAVGLSKTSSVTMTNAGIRVLKVEGITTEGPFSVQTVTTTLAPTRERDVMVIFTPTEVGPTQGKLLIASDDPEVPVTEVPLLGEGIEAAILVNPNPVDFETFLWSSGTLSRFIEVTVSNPGTDSFDLSAVDMTDDGQANFKLELDDSVGIVGPQEQRTFRVLLEPNGLGVFSGNVRLTTSIADLPTIDVPVLATVVGPLFELCTRVAMEPEVCTDTGAMPDVNFGSPGRGETVQAQIRLINRGDRDLTLDGSTGMVPPEITFNPPIANFQATVVPGAETAITATYLPNDFILDAVGVVFDSDAANRPSQRVQVTGRVASPSADAQRALTFSLEGASTDVTVSIRLKNCGDLDLNLTGTPRVVGDPAFTLVNPPSTGSVPPSADCTRGDAPFLAIPVRFAPPAIGTYMATVEIDTDDPRNPTITTDLVGTKR